MKLAIATFALALGSVTAFGQEATIFDDEFVSTKSRAEVRAEVMDALASGARVSFGEARRLAYAPRTSALSRDTVKDRTLDAIEDGKRLKYGEADQQRILKRAN